MPRACPISVYTNFVQPNPAGRKPGDRSILAYRKLERLPAIPPPAGGGLFNPYPRFTLLSAQVGPEPSTTCRWWDSGVFLCFCRQGLNDPPAFAGGIEEVFFAFVGRN